MKNIYFALSLACAVFLPTASVADINDSDRENLVKRSYQYVALFNTINNFVVNPKNPFASGAWNKTFYPKGLMDASVKALPRPNNDTLYVLSPMDLRDDAVVITYPAFESRYVTLETSSMDHFVDIPLATSNGDFQKPVTVLFYSDRTDGYDGTAIDGVDEILKMSGDFSVAFARVMPEANDPAKFKANLAAIDKVKMQTLSEFQGKPAKPISPLTMPAYGNTTSVYSTNFAEVMQFIANHQSFDTGNAMDAAALDAMKSIGIVPNQPFDAAKLTKVDSKRLVLAMNDLEAKNNAIWNNPDEQKKYEYTIFQPKPQMDIDAMVLQSVVGPLGNPAQQAMYPGIATTDGKPMTAENDYVIRMSKDELPPAIAFWSATLYDTKQGFFIPNAENKYSVGINGGMKLDDKGGIEIHIAAEQPAGVPKENWLPITRSDIGIDVIMRIYQPDLDKMKTWNAPKAELVK